MNSDPRIDAYIAKSAAFAQPILRHLREMVRAACPEARETIKWGMPFWSLENRPLCHMAAFKAHAAFGFWGEHMRPHLEGIDVRGDDGMGSLGRLTTLADLPPDPVLRQLLQHAAVHVRSPQSAKTAARPPRTEAPVPDDLAAALEASPPAARAFADFSPSRRREYIDWVIEAKRPETRAKRVATTVAQCAEGRPLHWKYQQH